MSNMALVTGASGFIAQQLVIDLLDKGYTVRGTVRSPAKGEKLKSTLASHTKHAARLELVEADLEKDDGWDAAVAGVDVIHHLASPFPLAVPKDPQDLIRPARDGTLRVLKAAKRADVKRIIMTSSNAAIAYGWGDERPALCTEEHWSNPNNAADCPAYPASKTIAERAAWDYVNGEGKGLELTCINPVGVFGPIRCDDVRASVGVVAQMMEGKFPMLPNAGIQVTDVRDVSAAHIAAMENPESIGERYIVADDFFSMRDIAEILRAEYPELTKKISIRAMPDFLVNLIALFNADMKTIKLELNKRRMSSPAKLKKLLGRDLIPARESILESAATLYQYNAV